MDPARKKELKRQYGERERAAAREKMLLDEGQLRELVAYLDGRIEQEGCDDTLRLTREWAAERQLDGDQLAHSLGQFGGFCDCEVVLNVDPETIFV